MGAAITAFVVHFSVYYGSLTPLHNRTSKNPAFASALAIVCALMVGSLFYQWFKKQLWPKTEIEYETKAHRSK